MAKKTEATEPVNSIEIKDIGPIEGPLSIPLHKDGGVIVLVGPNGSGKDEAIKAIRHGLGGKEKISRRDGTKFGTLQMPGVSMRITSSIRRKGQADVVSLDGELNYSDFVYPNIKDPAAADRARIRLLCRLHHVKPDATRFHELLGGEEEFAEIASSKTTSAEDLDAMAASLAEDLHKAKRKCRDAAKVAEGRAVANERAVAEVDLDAPHDPEFLQEQYDKANSALARITEQREAWERGEKRRKHAENHLAQAMSEYKGPSVEEAGEALGEAGERHKKAVEEVERLRAELEQAERTETACLNAVHLCEARHESALQHARTIEECKRAIASAVDVENPGDEQIEAARRAKQEARAAIEAGVLVREALQKVQEGQANRAASKELAERADQYADKAKGVLEILADAIGTGVLWIEQDENDNPRFVFDHPSRGTTYFHDLSDGEKWTIAMLDAVEHVRRNGIEGTALFPIEQRAWEGLDAGNKALIARAARRHRINVVTAQARQDMEQAMEVVSYEPPEEAA